MKNNDISADFGAKKPKFDCCIYPSPGLSSSVVEPYNSVLSTHSLLEYTDVCFLMDNEATYEICRRSLQILQPSYSNVNQLIAQTVSSLTSSLRFDGKLISVNFLYIIAYRVS